MSTRAESLQSLLRDTRLWRGATQAPLRAQATGHAQLDAALPGGGWPCASLSEIVYATAGVGELQLAMPLAARLTQGRRRLALIAPPHLPYAPALRQYGVVLAQLTVIETINDSDALWAAEELLRARAGAVLLWQDGIDTIAQRRLQLAAETGDGIALVYRRLMRHDANSVAALRLKIARVGGATQIEVLKCRGARPTRTCALDA
ncbi:translesion DNA synthesis-associated protein ImuA [Solimonas terrae]|uniref:Translesion DNA synthesis-associated protein ImuA n=1 Tax=Solimonas terrae TaxID=1396819 RepID=A0A6M2BQ03_9GAMM|nr:translesion DNA synthesis-associated protein ImuA [Solimonas terrae]NGY04370.1 translesion DNA synthesis-associated protein ImuA [Solimonas terrae]